MFVRKIWCQSESRRFRWPPSHFFRRRRRRPKLKFFCWLAHILRRIACMFVCIYILTSVGLWPIMFCIRDIYSDTVYSSKTFGIFLFVLQLSWLFSSLFSGRWTLRKDRFWLSRVFFAFEAVWEDVLVHAFLWICLKQFAVLLANFARQSQSLA